MAAEDNTTGTRSGTGNARTVVALPRMGRSA